MALDCAVGTFWLSGTAATTTTSVTSLSFEPKALILFSLRTFVTVDTAGISSANFTIGVAASTTDRAGVSYYTENAAMAADNGGVLRTDCVISYLTDAAADSGKIDLDAFLSNGFRVINDTATGAAYRIGYIALGGSDITNVDVGVISEPAATGDQDTTTPGFQPDMAMFLWANTIALDTIENDATFGIGFAAGATPANRVVSTGTDDGAATMNTARYSFDTECIGRLDSTLVAVEARAAISSWLSTGFRLNWTERITTGKDYVYLVIKGGKYFVGDFLTQTNTTTDIIESGFGFSPKGALVISHGTAKSTVDTVQNHSKLSVGAFSSTTAQTVFGFGDDDNVADAAVRIVVDDDEIYGRTSGAALEGLAELKSIDSDGFTAIMTDADPDQAFVSYLAFGNGVVAYTLSCASGSFTITGTSASPLYGHKVAANSGTYTETGTAANLVYNRPIAANSGSYSITGTAAGLLYGHRLSAASGSYSEAGTVATLSRSRLFAADSGSYSVTGTAATLKKGYPLVATNGSYSITGTTASLLTGKKVAANSGAYSITGTAATLVYNRPITASSGSYSVTGTAASLLYGHKVAANSGSYSVTGTAATLKKGYLVAANSGSYAITGTAAVLKKGYPLVASSGTYTVTGTAASLLTSRKVSANSGSYAITGTAASLLKGYKVSANSGSYVLTGQNATLTYGQGAGIVLSANSGSFAVTGTAAGLARQLKITAIAYVVNATGTAATLLYKRVFPVDSIPYLLSGKPATLQYGKNFSASAGSFALTGTAATLIKGRAVIAETGTYNVTGTAANLVFFDLNQYLLQAEQRIIWVRGKDVDLIKGDAPPAWVTRWQGRTGWERWNGRL